MFKILNWTKGSHGRKERSPKAECYQNSGNILYFNGKNITFEIFSFYFQMFHRFVYNIA